MSTHKIVATTFMRSLTEILELLETTAPDDAPVRVRLKPDRRVRTEPPPGGVDRRKSVRS